MRFTSVLVGVFAAVASCQCPAGHEYRAPSATDRRSPCPMVNALANHGFIARNGLNVSITDFVNGLEDAVNLNPNATLLVASLALATSTTGNPTTVNLDDLDKHNIIEHDSSLSRNDYYFGDNHSFNRTIWDATASWFTNETISIATAAKARAARTAAAAAVNPSFTFGAAQYQFSLLESALYLRTFGNGTQGNAKTSWVNTLFRHERLPYELGYQRPATAMFAEEILYLAAVLAAVPT